MTTTDPSAVLAAIKAELYEARGVDLVDFNTITLLADALQAVLDACKRIYPEAPGKDASEYGPSDFVRTGQLTAINVIVETITTALAKGETS